MHNKLSYMSATPRAMTGGAATMAYSRMESDMTRTAPKAKASASYFDPIGQTLDGIQSKIEVPAAARDFVKKGADAASGRAESVHSTATRLVDGAEKLSHSFVGGYADFVRGAFDMTLANVKASLAAMEKVAAAQSINEAVQIQADFVRESTAANIERVREAAETARTGVVDGARAVQAEVASLYKQAA